MAKRRTEAWIECIFALADLDMGAKGAGWGLAQSADWDTGENARPSMRTLAAKIGMTREAAARAIGRLQRRGLIEHTGNAAFNIKIYRLIFPPGCDPDVTSSRDSDVTTNQAPVVTPRRSVVIPRLAGCDPDITQPPHTSSDRRSEDEDEDARAAAPSADAAGDRAAPVPASAQAGEAVREIVFELTRGPDAPRPWQRREIDPRALLSVVDRLLAAGYTTAKIVDHALTCGTPKHSPTRLLAAHLEQLAGEDPAAWRAAALPAPLERQVRRALGLDATVHDVICRLPRWQRLDADDTANLFTRAGRPAKSAAAREAFDALARSEIDGVCPPLALEDGIERQPCAAERCDTATTFVVRGSQREVVTCPNHAAEAVRYVEIVAEGDQR